MSNKRRKRTGTKKLLTNRLIRVLRGAHKNGTPPPGYGRNTPTADITKLQTQLAEHTNNYWHGTHPVYFTNGDR